jgi:hypothetical protein
MFFIITLIVIFPFELFWEQFRSHDWIQRRQIEFNMAEEHVVFVKTMTSIRTSLTQSKPGHLASSSPTHRRMII